MSFISWINTLNSTSFVQFIAGKLSETGIDTVGSGQINVKHIINGSAETWASTLDNYVYKPADGIVSPSTVRRRIKIIPQVVHSGNGSVSFSHTVYGRLIQSFIGKSSLAGTISILGESEQCYNASGSAITNIEMISAAEEVVCGISNIEQAHSIESSGSQDTTYIDAILYLDEDLYLSKYC
jgi:hypothetical protein